MNYFESGFLQDLGIDILLGPYACGSKSDYTFANLLQRNQKDIFLPDNRCNTSGSESLVRQISEEAPVGSNRSDLRFQEGP